MRGGLHGSQARTSARRNGVRDPFWGTGLFLTQDPSPGRTGWRFWGTGLDAEREIRPPECPPHRVPDLFSLPSPTPHRRPVRRPRSTRGCRCCLTGGRSRLSRSFPEADGGGRCVARRRALGGRVHHGLRRLPDLRRRHRPAPRLPRARGQGSPSSLHRSRARCAQGIDRRVRPVPSDRFRSGRHESEYFDPDRPVDKTEDDARWAASIASAAVAAVAPRSADTGTSTVGRA